MVKGAWKEKERKALPLYFSFTQKKPIYCVPFCCPVNADKQF